jgi:hypothetical protein
MNDREGWTLRWAKCSPMSLVVAAMWVVDATACTLAVAKSSDRQMHASMPCNGRLQRSQNGGLIVAVEEIERLDVARLDSVEIYVCILYMPVSLSWDEFSK